MILLLFVLILVYKFCYSVITDIINVLKNQYKVSKYLEHKSNGKKTMLYSIVLDPEYNLAIKI